MGRRMVDDEHRGALGVGGLAAEVDEPTEVGVPIPLRREVPELHLDEGDAVVDHDRPPVSPFGARIVSGTPRPRRP